MQENKDTVSKVANIESFRTPRGNTEVRAEGSWYSIPYYKDGFMDTKEFNTFVRKVESLVRKSDEYKRYVGYVRNVVGLNRCSFMPNFTGDDAELEFHHYPLTLWDCAAMISEHMVIESKKKVSSITVAEELLAAHYRNEVGGVMLSKTAHQMTHAGLLFVHLSQVFGDVNGFIERYKLGMTEEIGKNLNQLVELSANTVPQAGCMRVEQVSWNLTNAQGLTPDDLL